LLSDDSSFHRLADDTERKRRRKSAAQGLVDDNVKRQRRHYELSPLSFSLSLFFSFSSSPFGFRSNDFRGQNLYTSLTKEKEMKHHFFFFFFYFEKKITNKRISFPIHVVRQNGKQKRIKSKFIGVTTVEDLRDVL
jgi:hypothetical protein